MAVRETIDFDGGTAGQPIAVEGNIVESSGAVYTAAAIHGELAMDAPTGSDYIRVANAGTVNHSLSIYARPTANPGSGSARLVAWTTAANGIIASARLHNDGRVDLANAVNARQDASTTSYTVGQVLRLDAQWDQSTQASPVLTVRVFITDAEGTTPDDTLTFTAGGIGDDQARWQVGAVGPTAWSAQPDTMRLADGLEWIGPFITTVDDATHGQTASQPTLTQIHQLTAADATHNQSAGSPTIGQASTVGWGGVVTRRDLTGAAVLDRQRAATVCPNDGTSLRTGPRGQLYCPFDGYQPARGW